MSDQGHGSEGEEAKKITQRERVQSAKVCTLGVISGVLLEGRMQKPLEGSRRLIGLGKKDE